MKKISRFLTILLACTLMLGACGKSNSSVISASLGTLEENTYTNGYAGFGCTLDDSWILSSAEELQDLPEDFLQRLEVAEPQETVSDFSQIADLMAEKSGESVSMNVLYTELSAADREALLGMDDDAVADFVLKEKDQILESYQQSGIGIASMEKVQVDFLGEKRTAVLNKMDVGPIDLFILKITDPQPRGKYAVTVTLTAPSQETLNEMLALFYPLH